VTTPDEPREIAGRPRNFLWSSQSRTSSSVSSLPYSIAILSIGVANLAFAAIAYLQRAKQIRGNALREHQLELAETRNELAESRLRRLDDQLVLLGEIRDALCGSATGQQIAARSALSDLTAAQGARPPAA
jgi:hypothetical protein